MDLGELDDHGDDDIALSQHLDVIVSKIFKEHCYSCLNLGVWQEQESMVKVNE